jgi:hypothetical protein
MANRNVHAGMIIVSYPSSIKLLMNVLVKNSQIFMKQNQLKKQTNNYYTAVNSLFESIIPYIPTINNKIDTKTKNNVINNFITDLKAIRKIKGKLWELSTANDITHGVVFVYLTKKAGVNAKKCLDQLAEIIKDKQKNDSKILAQFNDAELKKLYDELDKQVKYIDKICGTVIGAVRIYDGVEIKKEKLTDTVKTYLGVDIKIQETVEEKKSIAYARLDPQLKKIRMFKNPITHNELSAIKYPNSNIKNLITQADEDIADDQTDADAAAINDPISQTDETVAINNPNSQTDVEKFGVFRGKSMILPDEIATQILDILREKGNKLSWLSNIKFGKHKLEKHKITPQNYQKIHQDNIFLDIDDLTEQQVRSYFLNYVVDDLDDSQSHVNRTIEVYVKDKENEEIRNRADYFVSINGVYIPFEAKKDIVKRSAVSAVLHQIRKYANITEFTKTEYDVNAEEPIKLKINHNAKFIEKTISIAKPHGVVLIGDRKGIYLAYSDSNRKGYFVQRNGKQLFWSCLNITPDVINEIKKNVSKLYELNDKFTNGNTTYSYKERDGLRQIDITYSLEHVEPPKQRISSTVNETSIPETSDDAIDIDYIISALQPLRPYTGADRMLMNNVALIADSINAIPKDTCPVESLWLCTPVSNNVYFTRIDDVWFPVQINYVGIPTAIDYKKYTNIDAFQAPSAVIPIEEHGISLVASPQGLDIMYTDENGNTTTLHKKIPINTPDERTQARDTISEYYNNILDEELE